MTDANSEPMISNALPETTEAESAVSVKMTRDQAAAVWRLIAMRARVSVDQLTPQTNLIYDLGMDGPSLGLLMVLIKQELDSDILSVLRELQARFQVDGQGCLTADSQERLKQFLPSIEFNATKAISFDDVFTVATIEAMAGKALSERPADLPFEGIMSPKQQEWVRRLPEELGERRLRLLLAGGCRHAFQPRHSLEREVTDALELLERFADTGQSKKALRDFRRAYLEEWRGGRRPEYRALCDALNPTASEAAVTNVTHAIKSTYKLSDTEALRELLRLHRDLVSPLADPGEFAHAWRTPLVVGLAESMYKSRDFCKMPCLADALEQAGCTNQSVLDHCRDPKAIHIRGCWVIDAILDGSWARVSEDAVPKKRSLLARFPIRDQCWIRELTDDNDGHLTVEQYLAKRWDFEAFEKARGATDEYIANRIARWSSLCPTWTSEQVRIALSFQSVCKGWGTNIAIARRIVREDPAELGRGESLAGRLMWLRTRLEEQAHPGMGEEGVAAGMVLYALAVRDVDLAQRVAEIAARVAAEQDANVFSPGILAAFHRDFDSLRSSIAQVRVERGQQWTYKCLKGIGEQNSELATQGLQELLDNERRKRDKEVVEMWAHGFYRLCQWASPDLVADFDVTQSWPWDAEFHAWVDNHDNPLAGVDLAGISPLLHEAVVLLRPSAWWAEPAGLPTDICEVVLTNVGSKPGAVIQVVKTLAGVSETEARRILLVRPAIIRSGVSRVQAHMMRQSLIEAGASAEVKKV